MTPNVGVPGAAGAACAALASLKIRWLGLCTEKPDAAQKAMTYTGLLGIVAAE